jgi:WD40 repeat protein
LDNGNITIWDVNKQQVVHTLTVHNKSGPVRCLKMLYDEKTLASSYDDGTIKLWNIYNGALLKTLTGHVGPVTSLEQLNNGYLISTSVDYYPESFNSTIHVWDLVKYKCWLTIFNAHVSPAKSGQKISGILKLLSDGNFASSGADYNIKIWNTAWLPYTMLFDMRGYAGIWLSLELLSDDTLASASDDGSVRIWNATTGKRLKVFYSLRVSLNFAKQVSSDPIILACGGLSKSIVFLNTQTDARTLVTPTSDRNGFTTMVVFNSTFIYAGDCNGKIQLLNSRDYEIGEAFNLTNSTSCVNFLETFNVLVKGVSRYLS